MRKLKIVSTSDIHLGHRRVTGEVIYERLKKFLYPQLKDADIFFICGDFFERLLDLIASDAFLADRIISDLYHLSLTHGFKIRVLRGTYQHDRRQCKKFEAIQQRDESDRMIDVKYVEEIAIEYIEDLDLKLLYLPDDLPYKNSDDVLALVHEMLQSAGWTSVDIVIGHGYFDHVLPPNVTHAPPCLFRWEQFKDIVDHWVIFGHVHTPSVYKRVVYNGSFDRLSHGEEEKKGFMVFTRTNGVWSAQFIENEDATKFVTIELHSDDPFECKEKFHVLVRKKFGYDPQGFVRVIHASAEIRTILQKECAAFYQNLVYSHKKSKVEERSVLQLGKVLVQSQEEVVPTPETLADLVVQFEQEMLKTSTLTVEEVRNMLKNR